ncbi:response regulator [Bacteroides salyersiae]|uniref:hybrid sensor histidine kinase/response regulator transcription factor n=1 Tax=Bacteroides salyersiae TaxID=291644 RepID=UPI001C38D280|nr:hybrid sensor histidine kinase/response regulator transcription factor [Bacteroides salyersiae]MBV4202581.1 response regulator [Bacteroides salyersiae]MCB6648132.1 response regulator [Bacteroides salyersiae]
MLKLFLIILYLVCPFVLSAQSLMHVRYYSAKDGLSQNTVADFLQDDKGYIWMATWNGLEKFDGYTFQNYKSYPTDDTRLEYNRIQQIIKSQKGNIWCITYNNLLYLFDTRTEKFRNVFSGYPHLAGYEEVARIYKQTGGILWFSNKAGELFRIDEERLGEADGIVHLPCRSCAGHGQKIYTVYQDKRGYEWILTEQGTFVYNHPEIQTDVRLRYVKEADKSTYFLTEGGELYTFVPDAGILHIPNPFPMKPVSGLVSIKSGRLLIPDSEKVIVYDTRKKFFEQLYRQEAALDPLHVTGVHYSRKNVIWMLSGQRVLRYTPTDRKVTSFQVNLTGTDTFRHVHEDEFGGIWFMTRSGSFYSYNSVTDGLEPAYRYTTGQKEPYRTEGRAFLRDSHKNLWVSRKYGFDKIYFTNRNYDYIHTSAEQEVRGVFIDSKKRLWVASKENRLEVYDKQGNYVGNMDSTGKLLQNRNISFGRNVYTFFEDSEHRLWLGTRNHGIVVATEYDGKFTLHTFRHDKQDPYALSNDAIYSICRDTRNRIWIGTLGGGINLFSGTLDNPRFIHSENLMKGYPGDMCHKVRSLYCTRKGVVLAGTTEGLLSFSDDFQKPEDIEFFHNDCEDGLSNNDVMDVLESRDGKIYIAAYSGGICMADVDSLLNTRIRFHYLNMKNGLPSDLPQSMLEDGEGNIWICFENYISKYKADRKGFDTYDSANLHTDLQITEAHPAIDQQGAMYIGTNQGVLRLRLYDLKKSSFVPRIVYAGVDIQNSDGTVFNSVLAVDSLVLGKKERNVTIAFSALDYTNSEALQYAYRLKGISDQWGYIGENHSIGFANLPSGDFVLEVKSTNGDGVWCDNITPLYIHIQPRFTETAWAWVLYVLIAIILILTVSGIIVYITNLKRKVTLEQQLTDLKLRFFTDISHELRTPLTLISGSIEEIVERGQLQKSGTENMQVARRNVNRMLRLVNQILDFRKIQGRKMKLSIEQGDVVALCRQVGENFTQLAHERSIHFRLIPETPEIRCYTDMDKLEKILFNLLSNAFKYTADGKSITMAVRMESGCLFVSVRDEGKGMDLRKIDNLFGRFETFGKTDPNRSTGIGLSLVKEFVDLLHGTIQPESIPGQGTVFTVTLPCTYEAYAADSMAEFVLNDEVKFEYPVEVQLSRQEEKERSILIIEDNDELRRFLAMILRDCYHVLEAGDGRQGLEIIGRELPDLIVSDVMMPEMDGIELLAAVKVNRDTSHIPVILLSAKASVDDRVRGLEYGADDYIAKPFNSAYLKARIESLIRQRSSLAAYYLGSSLKDSDKTEKKQPDVKLEQVLESVPSFNNTFIQEVIRLVDENLQNPDFKIDDLAETMNMSRAVFYRKIKTFTGASPIDLVKEMRLKRALELLDADTYSLSEVAYQSGFSSPQYFSRVFKEQMQCTPNEYKRRKAMKN